MSRMAGVEVGHNSDGMSGVNLNAGRVIHIRNVDCFYTRSIRDHRVAHLHHPVAGSTAVVAPLSSPFWVKDATVLMPPHPHATVPLPR